MFEQGGYPFSAVTGNNTKSIDIFRIPGLPAYRNTQVAEEKHNYLGLTASTASFFAWVLIASVSWISAPAPAG